MSRQDKASETGYDAGSVDNLVQIVLMERSDMMQAERVVLETDIHGNLIGLPKLPPKKRLEVIFLLLEENAFTPNKRTPPARLKGTVTTIHSLLEPILSDVEWDASLDRTARQIAGEPEAFQ